MKNMIAEVRNSYKCWKIKTGNFPEGRSQR